MQSFSIIDYGVYIEIQKQLVHQPHRWFSDIVISALKPRTVNKVSLDHLTKHKSF